MILFAGIGEHVGLVDVEVEMVDVVVEVIIVELNVGLQEQAEL